MDEGENKMSFRRKRDFVHDLRYVHDDDFDKNIVRSENKHVQKN